MAQLAKPRSAKRDPNGQRKYRTEALKKLIFDRNSPSSTALHRLPQNRRGSLIARNHRQDQRAVIALCELRPVHRDHKLGAISSDKLQPVRSQIFAGKQLVTEESVSLFDGVFGSQTAGLRKTASDV